jgi:hypothetical protein
MVWYGMVTVDRQRDDVHVRTLHPDAIDDSLIHSSPKSQSIVSSRLPLSLSWSIRLTTAWYSTSTVCASRPEQSSAVKQPLARL